MSVREEHPHVVIAGGGIAALEALLALHDMGHGRLRITLISPREEFVLEPLRPANVMGDDLAPRHSLRMFTRRYGASLVRDALRRVLPDEHIVECVSGRRLAYDVLIVATGARRRAVSTHPITYGCEARAGLLRDTIQALARGAGRSIAFVVPPGTSWPLPAYELALEAAARTGDAVEIAIVTPEAGPLDVFGANPSLAVARLLSDAGIRFEGSAEPSFAPGRVLLGDGRELEADAVVSLPALDGPHVGGLPGDEDGFIVCDEHARVVGVPDVYAAGDATSYAIKQGGIATQQADAACEHIAARFGFIDDARPARPVLRGKLLAPTGPLYLRNVLGDPQSARASKALLWFPPSKVSGRYVSSWLESVSVERAARRAAAAIA